MTRTYLLAGGRRVRAHRAAHAFPLLTEDELSALAADILEHGQRVPVLLQRGEDGVDVVIDGRNRLLACEAGGVEPEVAYVEPTADAVPVIVSLNWARRHQGESQRAMSAARLVNLVRGRPGRTASTTIDALSQGRAAGLLHLGRATVQRAAAIVDDPILAPAVDAEQVSVSDAYAIRHATDEAKQRALAAVADGSARTLRGALERAAAEPATGGLGSTEPAADRATGRSGRRRDAADTGAVMASPDAPAALDSGSGSASELVEPSTAGATDAEAHRAAEPGGTAAADPAGGGAASDSASSSGSVSGDTTSAVQDRELGGAGASPEPAPSLPTPLAVSAHGKPRMRTGGELKSQPRRKPLATPVPSPGVRLPGRRIPGLRTRPAGRRRRARRHRAAACRAIRRQQCGIGSWAAPVRRPSRRRRCLRRWRRFHTGSRGCARAGS